MLRPAVSQTPSEPASHRTLARARARGDVPFAQELPMALALLALAVVAQPAWSLARALRRFAISAWSGQLAFEDATAMLRALTLSLLWVLCIPALAALIGVLVQRASTLRIFATTGESRSEPRGRPARGRIAHNLLAALKAAVLAASLGVLFYDSLPGFFESYTRSSSQLLTITGQVLPAYLVRAACAFLVLAGVELGAQYLERARRLRMTRQQVQDEQRELAADPRMLSERRTRSSAGPSQLRAASVLQLSAAALLITGRNCVVALQYDPEKGVPTVLLTAQSTLAVELLQRAYVLELPVANDELLVLALSRLPAGANIPTQHHARVAQLLVAKRAPAVSEAS